MEIKKFTLTREERAIVRKIFEVNLLGLILLILPFLFVVFILFTVRSSEYEENMFLIFAFFLSLTTLALPFFYAGNRLRTIRTAFKIMKGNKKTVISGKLVKVWNEKRNLIYQIESENYILKSFLSTFFYIHNYDVTTFDFYLDQEVIIYCLPEMQLLLDINYLGLKKNKEKKTPLDGADAAYIRNDAFNLFKPALGIVSFDIILIVIFYFITDIFDLTLFLSIIILNVIPFLPNLLGVFKSFRSKEKIVISGIVTEKFKIDIGYKNNDLISMRYCIRLSSRLFKCTNVESLVVGEDYSVAFVLNKDGSMGRMLGRQNV